MFNFNNPFPKQIFNYLGRAVLMWMFCSGLLYLFRKYTNTTAMKNNAIKPQERLIMATSVPDIFLLSIAETGGFDFKSKIKVKLQE